VAKRFELFVALRYLKAKRKQAVISVITGISILGVAATSASWRRNRVTGSRTGSAY